MKKYLDIIAKVLLSLILAMPILGLLHIFPAPTREMYHNEAAYTFVSLMMNEARYIDIMMVIVFVLATLALWTKREALAALLIAPIVANIVGFHAFLDGGLLTSGAMMGNIMLLLNIYFLWQYRAAYKNLL